MNTNAIATIIANGTVRKEGYKTMSIDDLINTLADHFATAAETACVDDCMDLCNCGYETTGMHDHECPSPCNHWFDRQAFAATARGERDGTSL